MKMKIEDFGRSFSLNGSNRVKVKNYGPNSVWISFDKNGDQMNAVSSKFCHEIIPTEEINVTNTPLRTVGMKTRKNETSEVSLETA